MQTFAQISGHSAGLIFVIGEVCEIRPWKVFAAFQKYVRKVTLPDGKRIPALRQATWGTGESERARAKEVTALRLGIVKV